MAKPNDLQREALQAIRDGGGQHNLASFHRATKRKLEREVWVTYDGLFHLTPEGEAFTTPPAGDLDLPGMWEDSDLRGGEADGTHVGLSPAEEAFHHGAVPAAPRDPELPSQAEEWHADMERTGALVDHVARQEMPEGLFHAAPEPTPDQVDAHHATLPPAVRPYLSPVTHADQEFKAVPDSYVLQLLVLLDAGARFEHHSDGHWRHVGDWSPLPLDTTALRAAIDAGLRTSLVKRVPYPSGAMLRSASVHWVTQRNQAAPVCGRLARRAWAERFRLTQERERVTCRTCQVILASMDAIRENRVMAEARGLREKAVVTIHTGTRRHEVLEVHYADQMCHVVRIVPEDHPDEVRPQWVSWDLLHAVR